ncbi:protein bric-a-brac 1-like [Toxorhynchites rutilus septentrionalis]|uniref:protein bric-a-brac 1-like n=1 Tax=Toxorhynchites rutilus septentrionalis TaxID=329112 RepID=UPI00247B2BDA|nr:protein bric-a-brac 1-like [Toxorhynchites rutilus septentrionalis]
MGSSEAQTYCLRWNNHKSNLVEILDALIKMECYVDCTIYVDDQVQFKAHRVVLAANSPYFQSILQDVPMDHCTILFPGVKEFEMRALLEYMYTGEVNVTQAQIPRIMKIAEQLEVKGLFDMADLKGRFGNMVDERERESSCSNGKPHTQTSNQQSPPAVISTSTNVSIDQSSSSSPPYSYKFPYTSMYSRKSPTDTTDRSERDRERDHDRDHEERDRRDQPSSLPQPPPPHSSYSHSSERPQDDQPQTSASSSVTAQQQQSQNHRWSLPAPIPVTLQSPHQLHSMLSSVYDSNADMNPLKRKKLQSMSSMLRDTPILRNVLAQPNAADSSQPSTSALSLQSLPGMNTEPSATVVASTSEAIHHPADPISSHHANGGSYRHVNEPLSPFGDGSYDDEAMMDPRLNYNADGHAPYASHQQQKPEWKRYKQYLRQDLMNAVDCVRKGMSALQASRKFGVPSRTLYDKVKKMGITTGRQINRGIKRSPSASSSPATFPYGLSDATHMFTAGPSGEQQIPSQSQIQSGDKEKGRMINPSSTHHLPPTIPHPAATLLDPTFLQQALEARGGDIAGREALHAMAFAAAAHAAVNGINTSPRTHGTAARSPSPNVLMKYMRSVSMGPVEVRERTRTESNEEERHHHHHRSNGSDTYERPERELMEHEDSRDISGGGDDMVEDLSMTRRGPSSDRGSISPPPMLGHSQHQPPPPHPQHLLPHPPPQIPPQQQGVIVPAPGKAKEDYNSMTIKREVIPDSNVHMESS